MKELNQFRAHVAVKPQQVLWLNITRGGADYDVGQVARAKISTISHKAQPHVV